MTVTSNATLNIREISEKLSDYAIDRAEMKFLLDCLPPEIKINHTTIEYELQLLRILAVGWSINYYVQDDLLKQSISEYYWNLIQQFSNNISTISSASTNQAINYFQIIKQRLDTYLDEFNNLKQADDPTTVIGPIFAELCGHPENAIVIWLGSKMFQSILSKIKIFLSDAQFVTNSDSINPQSDND
jgi:hypothetical protein